MSMSDVAMLMRCMRPAFTGVCGEELADALARAIHNHPELQDALSEVISDWLDTTPERFIKVRSMPFDLTVKGEMVTVTAISFTDAGGGIEDGRLPLWIIEKLGGAVLDVGDTAELDVEALCDQLDAAGLDMAFTAAFYVNVGKRRQLVHARHYKTGWDLVGLPECESGYAALNRAFYLVIGLP